MSFPRITFGIIVLNGEPFTRYTLRALYPYAHEIIVVEGGAAGAINITTPDGHSRDGTLETLYQFKKQEDPDNKLQIITRDGLWSEKDEMSQAYAQQATGDYLWQVDVDEFYHPHDMEAVLSMLKNDPDVTAVSFKMWTFWGSPDYGVDSWFLRRGAEIYHRLFKWGKGYTYVTHRPPTVHDAQGRNLRDMKWIDAYAMAKRGIRMYHYSLLLPKQVIEKCDYYSHAQWAKRHQALDWAYNNYLELKHPYHVHNVYKYPGWLYRFKKEHPPQIIAMWQALQSSSDIDIRQTNDIEALLDSPSYRLGVPLVILLDYPARIAANIRKIALKGLRKLPQPLKDALKSLLRRSKLKNPADLPLPK